MKKTTLTLIASLLTCSTLFSQASQADDHPDGRGKPVSHQDAHRGTDDKNHDRNNNRHDEGNNRHDEGKNHHDRDKNRHDDIKRPQGKTVRNDRDHFSWQGHDFRRGHAIPQEYRGDHYRIANWHERGLREPPSGEYWANINGNYVLVAAVTGVITSLVLGNALN